MPSTERPPSNSVFKLYRRPRGADDFDWIETGEVYRIDDDCGSAPDQRLTLDDHLRRREIEDGYDYEARPA